MTDEIADVGCRMTAGGLVEIEHEHPAVAEQQLIQVEVAMNRHGELRLLGETLGNPRRQPFGGVGDLRGKGGG